MEKGLSKPYRYLLLMVAAILIFGLGYRLGYEQNPCSALEIILSYPKVNNA